MQEFDVGEPDWMDELKIVDNNCIVNDTFRGTPCFVGKGRYFPDIN